MLKVGHDYILVSQRTRHARWENSSPTCTASQPSCYSSSHSPEKVESSPVLVYSAIGQYSKTDKELRMRLEKACKVHQIWRRKSSYIKPLQCICIYTLMMPVFLYGAGTWIITRQDIHQLKSFQMRCLQDILGITLWNRVDILEETVLLQMQKQLRQRCLQWFGHAWRMPTNHPRPMATDNELTHQQ